MTTTTMMSIYNYCTMRKQEKINIVCNRCGGGAGARSKNDRKPGCRVKFYTVVFPLKEDSMAIHSVDIRISLSKA